MGESIVGETMEAQRVARLPEDDRALGSAPVRAVIALAAVASAIALATWQEAYRRGEAGCAAFMMRWVLGSDAIHIPNTTLIVFDRGRDSQFAVRLVAGCSTSLILVPLALFVAALAASGRVRPARLVIAALVAAGIVYLGNMIRFLGIVVSVRTLGGWRGFGWGHTTIGSTIVLLAILVAGIAFYRLIRERPDRGSRRNAEATAR